MLSENEINNMLITKRYAWAETDKTLRDNPSTVNKQSLKNAMQEWAVEIQLLERILEINKEK